MVLELDRKDLSTSLLVGRKIQSPVRTPKIHQTSHDEAFDLPDSIASQEDTWEGDKETDVSFIPATLARAKDNIIDGTAKGALGGRGQALYHLRP